MGGRPSKSQGAYGPMGAGMEVELPSKISSERKQGSMSV